MASSFNFRGEPNGGDALFLRLSARKFNVQNYLITEGVILSNPITLQMYSFATAYSRKSDKTGRILGLIKLSKLNVDISWTTSTRSSI